ncbi:hypothetical protein D9758_007786 [Tetrapyrgos nigripes]|uniref:RED-like N-terminal domain-containing protein n=1 Tax=Tetrapyrgos nigripes TaxID=182062 RepID=A0A8H5CYD9_9AGAR|nr:hypothetical protein D9758_007786 [Tetrapyrgos nigripes]
MDQDSFRRLLNSGSGTSSQSRPTVVSKQTRASLFSKADSKPSTSKEDEASFKPRKVKKLNDKYRDRASERRTGEGNDYADVESVLEDFERRTVNQDKHVVDEHRQYLGGDSEHTILVKGLDMALLQANKAKAAQSTEEDDSLENAYLEAASTSTPDVTSSTAVPKKRTREDIIRELKGKRTAGSDVKDAAKDVTVDKGKFKPIGFKPIGSSTEEKNKNKKKKGKADGDGERKKKKRKVDAVQEDKATGNSSIPPPDGNADAKLSESAPANVEKESPPKPLSLLKKIIPAPPEDDDDIFADAGEYEGVELGDDDDEEEDVVDTAERDKPKEDVAQPNAPGNWFKMDDDPESVEKPLNSPPSPASKPTKLPQPSVLHNEDDDNASGDEQPMRLVPLSGSAVPSIKDFLAMDEAAETAEKKRKRKEKRKGIKAADSDEKQLTAEAKANRDYQRLKSYTDKSSAK